MNIENELQYTIARFYTFTTTIENKLEIAVFHIFSTYRPVSFIERGCHLRLGPALNNESWFKA